MTKNIINGPYLLDPRATQITVAWEAIAPQDFKVTARAADGTEHSGAVAYQREEKCQEYPQGACVYTAVIEGLEPATEYAYTIIGDGEVAAASFTTYFPLYPKNCGARPDNYPTVTPQSPQ